MDKDIMTEIRLLWNAIAEIGKKQSDFTDNRANEVKSIDGREFKRDRLNHSGDIVLWNGSFARCLHDNKGITPDNRIYWELLTVSDAILELIDRVSELEQED